MINGDATAITWLQVMDGVEGINGSTFRVHQVWQQVDVVVLAAAHAFHVVRLIAVSTFVSICLTLFCEPEPGTLSMSLLATVGAWVLFLLEMCLLGFPVAASCVRGV